MDHLGKEKGSAIAEDTKTTPKIKILANLIQQIIMQNQQNRSIRKD